MSNFKRAYERTMGHEGGYAFNPKDTGGETYKGVSRKNWPQWGGWKYVDGAKNQMTSMPAYGTSAYKEWAKHLNKCLDGINVLQNLVESFYRDNFWKRLGEINDQRIAEECFDKAVNCGVVAYKWLQRASGVGDDGQIGPVSIARINSLDPVQLLADFNTLAERYYNRIIENDPSQSVFRKSWLSRLKGYDDTPFVA